LNERQFFSRSKERSSVDKKDTIAFIDKQIELEHRIIAITEENVSKLGNVFVKQLLLAISQDSKKHAVLLEALRKAVEGPTPFISTGERDKIAKGIQKHIEMEAEAVKTYGLLMEQSGDEQVKTIASMIREDEFRHHALLTEIHKTIVEPETLTEDIIWDMIWKDSPWHGSPGG
jgi:rubrerythrin